MNLNRIFSENSEGMKIINSILLFFLISTPSLYSQILEGTVYDKQTGEPISQVSVYLSGTSMRTVTDKGGKFILNIEKTINADLIFSHVSYDIIALVNPFDEDLDKIYMIKKDNNLKEIVIEVSEILSREEKLKMFKREFLGNTKAGKACEILNEDDIVLRYNDEEKVLSASSERPILIKNKLLGYEISYEIIDFSVQYAKGLTLSLEPLTFFMRGHSVFTDMAPNNNKIKRRRKSTYKKTSSFFFLSLVDMAIEQEGFEILNGKEAEVDIYRGLSIKDTLSMRKVSIKPMSSVSYIPPELRSYTPAAFIHIYNVDGGWSNLTFLTETFLVDQYGIPDTIDKLVLSGNFASRRIGDMLPLDYKP